MEKVVILISTFNGEKYLKAQLDSLLNQTYPNIEIIARDDKSLDRTLEILKSYGLEVLNSQHNLGIIKSFECLIKFVLDNKSAKYIMFCDQDDVWKPNKVEETWKKIKSLEDKYGEVPLLVHSDLEVVDENLNNISNSLWKYEKICPERNSLNRLVIQNTITGCTMMINRNLANMSLPISSNAIMHDWWIGLVASAFGKIAYIDVDTIKYRQHANNDVGAKKFGIRYILKKISLYKQVDINRNLVQARNFVEQYKNSLDLNSLNILDNFASISNVNKRNRINILFRYKIFKFGFIRNVGFVLKVLEDKSDG